MSTTDHAPTIGDIVTANPGAARVFERHGIDFCCGGRRLLADACSAAGLDVGAVLAELDGGPVYSAEGWARLEPTALVDHIVTTHHAYLHEELPLLDALAEKVLGAHRRRHPELADVRRVVGEIKADLEPHLMKEERVLFPAISAVAAEGGTELPFGSIANPIRMMMLEHDRAGELLAELRRVTDGYRVPDDGCASFRSLYERLALLEEDIHLHVHKENNVLFPAVLRLADA